MAKNQRKPRRRPPLAVRIETYRKAAGLTRAELALLVGVAAPSVHQWESGRSRPRIDRVANLAETLGVSIDDLIGEAA